MSILDLVRPNRTSPVGFATTGDAVAVASSTADASTIITRSANRAALMQENAALCIPAVRKAQHQIAGTISTFQLVAREGDRLLPADEPRASWLTQPDPRRTLQWILYKTLHDGIWRDRAVWRILDRSVTLQPVKFERVHPQRIDTITDPRDPDTVAEWIIDGRTITDPDRELLVFDFAGLGGLRKFGYGLLDLYGKLQEAAGNYADAPHPKAILKNSGADLTDEEIEALLDSWEQARATRSVGYLNSVVEYDTYGWSASELQLVESREYAALEVARLFGLPAKALDARTGDSMTYSTAVEARRDLLEALRPWMTVISQTLSMQDRTGRTRGRVLPRGLSAEFLADAYTRDDPETRMQTWNAALEHEVLSLEEVRSLEPLARTIRSSK